MKNQQSNQIINQFENHFLKENNSQNRLINLYDIFAAF